MFLNFEQGCNCVIVGGVCGGGGGGGGGGGVRYIHISRSICTCYTCIPKIKILISQNICCGYSKEPSH